MTRRTVDWEDVDAAAPHQVLTRGELHQLGVTQRMIWARLRQGGPWQRVLPGVILLRNGTPTRDQLIAAALRYAGESAVVTGLAAASLHGLRKLVSTTEVHVLVPHEHRRINAGFVLVERTRRMPATIGCRGFAVAELGRSVLDAARRMRDRAQVEALVAEAVQRGRVTPAALRYELETGAQRGSALVRGALSQIDRGARSAAEARAMRLYARSGLPEMVWNPHLRSGSGARLPSPDGWIPSVALAWEIDSLEHHLSPEDYRRTLERHNVMVAHGIVVVHTVPSMLATEPETVLRHLREAYARALDRPRPDITIAS